MKGTFFKAVWVGEFFEKIKDGVIVFVKFVSFPILVRGKPVRKLIVTLLERKRFIFSQDFFGGSFLAKIFVRAIKPPGHLCNHKQHLIDVS